MTTKTQELHAQRDALLASHSVDELKQMYRLARQDQRDEAGEVRRWVTAELLKRLPRSEVVAFERSVMG